MTRTGSGVVLTVADDLLDLRCRKILADAYRTDERRAHDAFMFERQGEQDRDALVGSLLILTAYIKKYVFPAVAPIIRQAVAYSFGAFCQQKEYDVGALSDDAPRFTAPLVRFFKEKVGGHTHTELFAALYLVATVPVLRQRIAKARFGAVDIRSALAALFIEKVHIAVLTTLAALLTAVPRIPDVVHDLTSLLLIVLPNKSEFLLDTFDSKIDAVTDHNAKRIQKQIVNIRRSGCKRQLNDLNT